MIFRIAALSLTALALAAPAAAERRTGDERLAELLEGRVAGEPTNCIPTRRNARMYIIDDTAVIYETGRTVYVNYTRYPENLDSSDVLVIRDNYPTMCKTTRIEVRSPSMIDSLGTPLFLTDFIPYERASDDS